MNAPALPETIARGFGLQGEVAPGIGWLRLPLPFKPEDHINVWLIEDAKGITLVDTGLADEHNRALWQAALVEMAAIGQA
ncbi:MAG: hypothetical protein N2690_05405, partial [Rhodocyclaceae bacterium]|nr:hypothetical protein [Rhodocyclaceae bacterium]